MNFRENPSAGSDVIKGNILMYEHMNMMIPQSYFFIKYGKQDKIERPVHMFLFDAQCKEMNVMHVRMTKSDACVSDGWNGRTM
jgi:hypothetical protein